MKNLLRPKTIPDQLIRLGRYGDGGYVLPQSIFHQMDALYSDGVGEEVRLELDWSGRTAHEDDRHHDQTGPSPPLPEGATFFSHGLAGITLPDRDRFLNHRLPQQDQVSLKIDHEGAEYEWIENTDVGTMARHVPCPIIEFHQVFDQPFPAGLSRLLTGYHIVHLHDNHFGVFFGDSGESLGDTPKLTLLRKDHHFLGLSSRSYSITEIVAPNDGIAY